LLIYFEKCKKIINVLFLHLFLRNKEYTKLYRYHLYILLCMIIKANLYYKIKMIRHNVISLYVPTLLISSSHISVNSLFSLVFCSTVRSRVETFMSAFLNSIVSFEISADLVLLIWSKASFASFNFPSACVFSNSYRSSDFCSFSETSLTCAFSASSFLLNSPIISLVRSYYERH